MTNTQGRAALIPRPWAWLPETVAGSSLERGPSKLQSCNSKSYGTSPDRLLACGGRKQALVPLCGVDARGMPYPQSSVVALGGARH